MKNMFSQFSESMDISNLKKRNMLHICGMDLAFSRTSK